VTFDRAANAVRLIEQRLLPHRFQIVATRDYRQTAAAIRDMVVRGAPRPPMAWPRARARFAGATWAALNGTSGWSIARSGRRVPPPWTRSTP